MPKDYLLTIIEIVGVVQCLFLATALLYLPGNHKHANRWLGLFFLVFALIFAYWVLRQNDLLYLAPLTAFLRLPLFFLCGPLLYLYLYDITRLREDKGTNQSWRHFVVFALIVLIYLPGFTLNRTEQLHLLYYPELVRLNPLTAGLNDAQEWLRVVSSRIMQVFALHLGTYMVLSLRLLYQHKQRVCQHFSTLEKVSLDWMRNLLLAFAALWVLVAVRQLMFANTATGNLIDALLMPVLVVFLSALGLYGLLQKSILLPSPAASAESDLTAAEASNGKYQSSTLTAEQQEEGLRKLQALMQKTKPHLDSELTLPGLAASLELPARHLSQIINGRLGQNFLDFVNSYRIEEAKCLLADRSCTSSILTIAMDVGFNSKSAFYNAFKRHTNQTPSQYRSDSVNALASDPQT